MQIIKKIIIFSLIAMIIITSGILGYVMLKNEDAKKLNEVITEFEEYKLLYEPLGEVLTAYAVVDDVRYGKRISEEDLIPTDIPENCAENVITDIDEIIGKYYRINVTSGTVLSQDLIMDFPQTSDERSFDVITTFNPIGLELNDFVDIRFSLPSGEDYVALSHKRVEGVYGGILKLAMSEYDIMVYNSLLVDKILFKGSIIYATKYLEPGGQEAAVENYPISIEVLEILDKNVNTDKAISFETAVENRRIMESAYEIYSADELKKSLLEAGKGEIPSRIQNGESEYRTQKEIEEQKRLEEAILNGG